MNWLHLSRNEQFELYKIVLDKGLLALLIAVAGGIGALLLERYKFILGRQLQLSQITLPDARVLLNDAEALYRLGESTLSDLASRYVPFQKWAEAIINAPVTWPTGRNAVDVAIQPNDELVEGDGSRVTVGALLQKLAPDQSVLDLLQSPEFWDAPGLRKAGSGLAWALAGFWLTNLDGRQTSATMVRFAVIYLFAETIVAPRAPYLEQINVFRFKMMTTLGVRTRREKRAFDAISRLLEMAKQTVLDFPKTDAVTGFGREIPSASEILNKNYAAMVTQLRVSMGGW